MKHTLSGVGNIKTIEGSSKISSILSILLMALILLCTSDALLELNLQ